MLNRTDFKEYFDVRSWLATCTTGNGTVDSAIVNLRMPSDRRRNTKAYIYFNHTTFKYVVEKA